MFSLKSYHRMLDIISPVIIFSGFYLFFCIVSTWVCVTLYHFTPYEKMCLILSKVLSLGVFFVLICGVCDFPLRFLYVHWYKNKSCIIPFCFVIYFRISIFLIVLSWILPVILCFFSPWGVWSGELLVFSFILFTPVYFYFFKK